MVAVADLEYLGVLYHCDRISGKIEREEPDRHSVGVMGGAFPAAVDGRNRWWRRAVDRACCQGYTPAVNDCRAVNVIPWPIRSTFTIQVPSMGADDPECSSSALAAPGIATARAAEIVSTHIAGEPSFSSF